MRAGMVFPIGLGILVLSAGSLIFFPPKSSGTTQTAASASATAATTTEIFAQYPAPIATTTTTVRIPAGYVEYKNDQYHFSVFYPANLKIHFSGESGGAATITFQDVAAAQGFQIFVAPYAGTVV